eukprot:scaffold1314_cov393-Prasinococcus_capsulatus_cf.AAC.2
MDRARAAAPCSGRCRPSSEAARGQRSAAGVDVAGRAELRSRGRGTRRRAAERGQPPMSPNSRRGCPPAGRSARPPHNPAAAPSPPRSSSSPP